VITSSIKSWLYADLLLKPEELIMYRPASYGGLGILSVNYKAIASLIKNFFETAGHDKFRPSLYHTTLFRYHVLGDLSLTNPGHYNILQITFVWQFSISLSKLQGKVVAHSEELYGGGFSWWNV
jgi:hypothetical protein